MGGSPSLPHDGEDGRPASSVPGERAVIVLVVGAAGFIGRHLVRRLVDSGRDVRPCGTDPAKLRRLFPGLRCVAGDLGRDSAADWVPRLAGVDAVINAAGLIRETGRGRTYRAVHTEGPIALFDASALDPAGERLDWCVLRPSLVLGPGGQSTALFAALAAAPCRSGSGRGHGGCSRSTSTI